MQGSKKWGFVWWATGNNAGRAVRGFLGDVGCDDFYVYNNEGEIEQRIKDGKKIYGWRTHKQGVPKGFNKPIIISNARNPYDRATWGLLSVHNVNFYKKHGRELNYGEMKNILEKFLKSTSPTVPNIWNDCCFWKQFPILNLYPDYYIRVENLEEDIKKIDCIMDNADPSTLEEAFNVHVRNNRYRRGEKIKFDLPERKVEYNEDGTREWRKFYNQELADLVYEHWEDGFTLMGYDRDSWKINKN